MNTENYFLSWALGMIIGTLLANIRILRCRGTESHFLGISIFDRVFFSRECAETIPPLEGVQR